MKSGDKSPHSKTRANEGIDAAGLGRFSPSVNRQSGQTTKLSEIPPFHAALLVMVQIVVVRCHIHRLSVDGT
jgi:hypothetical protein